MIVPTCLDFNFEQRAADMQAAGFPDKEIGRLRHALRHLTNNLVCDGHQIILRQLEQTHRLETCLSDSMERELRDSDMVVQIDRLILECIDYGTIPFAILARLAFIGNAVLRSMVDQDLIGPADHSAFFRSVHTVLEEFCTHLEQYMGGGLDLNFLLRKYGHLRPGTYDITTPRYDEAPEFYFSKHHAAVRTPVLRIPWNQELGKGVRLRRTFKAVGYRFNPEELFDFTRQAIRAREEAKFRFSRHVSEILRRLTHFGRRMGFEPEQMSYLSIPFIRRSIEGSGTKRGLASLWEKEIGRKRDIFRRNRAIYLPPVIISSSDITTPQSCDARPNFITEQKVVGEIVRLQIKEDPLDIRDKIVLIERADPGYDWIFGSGLKGLITCYGGVASHMAIRCSELSLPAAIGCGVKWFQTLCRSRLVELNCRTRMIKIP